MLKSAFWLPVCVLLFLSLPVQAADVAAQAKAQADGDYVVLLHGIGRSSAATAKMAKDLTKRGYQVLNLDYPSKKARIEDIAEKIHADIAAFATDKTKAVHFAGHSMGALVIRAYIAKHRPQKLGRVVMLGTPNGGSEVADWLHNNPLYKAFYGPAGQQLLTDADFDKAFGKVDYEVGVIAGDRSIDPVSSFVIPGKDDGKVSIASTHLAGEKDHVVLHVNHATMPMNGAVIIETAHFLKYGFFKRETVRH